MIVDRFDPNSFIMPPGMRYPPQMPIPFTEETLEVDEHGNINWQFAWRKELAHLQQVTAQQEKTGADQEWYRLMFLRVRGALMAPLHPSDGVVMPHTMDVSEQNMSPEQRHDQQQ
jgi:forkhead box protein J2/3